MPSQPQKDRNEARVTTSFRSEFSSLHTNLTRYNDNRDITIQISRKRHIAPTSVDCMRIGEGARQGAGCAAHTHPFRASNWEDATLSVHTLRNGLTLLETHYLLAGTH